MSPARLPQLEDFTSAVLTAKPGEHFNPPGLTNFWGCLQAAFDVVGVQHLTFAPFSCGESILGTLAINDRLVMAAGGPIDFTWRPDRIERRAQVDDFALESTTVMGVREQSVTVRLRVRNLATATRAARLRLLTGEGIIRSDNSWRTPYSPRECPAISITPWEGTPPPSSLVRNELTPLPEGDGLLFRSRTSEACAVQAVHPAPSRIEHRALHVDWQLQPGETRELSFFIALGAQPADLAAPLQAWRASPFAAVATAEADWRTEIAAVFTPGNDRYSGHLPVLETAHEPLRAIYLNAAITAVYFKREHPLAQHGRIYVTLQPRYWVTTSFINDWSLAATLLVMLDPACVRVTVERWLERDIHRYFGTEYVSGASAGNWYSCNDYAMARLITTYVRYTGQLTWLEKRVGPKTVREHLLSCAAHYRTLVRDSGLADYGDRNSLLEAVGTYEHEVASLNAANVWILRETATLHEFLGDLKTALALRTEADALVPQVQQLYLAGTGHWACRQPDGSLVPVRHIWDFIHTINFLHADLPAAQLAEMVSFFQRELMTPTWLAALSPMDEDAGFSLRPDHQWNGSYPAWVSLAASALLRAGRADLLAGWLPGLGATARQGPYSQAHFVEAYAPPHAGGARKAPTEWPYINDWTCLSAGNFFETVLDLFGLEPGYAALQAKPHLAPIDPGARLLQVPWQGRRYTVAASGAVALQS